MMILPLQDIVRCANCTIAVSQPQVKYVKKHPIADELAARLTAAASQPPGIIVAPVMAPPATEPMPEAARKKPPRAKAKPNGMKGAEYNTVPISLRPGRALWNRYVLAAAERTRETGRVVSAQEIMLEILERL